MRTAPDSTPAQTPQVATLSDESQTMKEEIASAIAKASPPVAVVGANKIFDLTLSEWVAIATLCYIALQAFVLVRNEFFRQKGKRK